MQRTAFLRLTGGGRTWKEGGPHTHNVYGPFTSLEAIDDKRWIALSLADEGSLLAWTSDDGGNEWQRHQMGLTIDASSSWLGIPAMVTLPGGVVVTSALDGLVLRSADRGESWTTIETGFPLKGTYPFRASCTDGQELVVLGGRYLVRSLDAGLTWDRGHLR